MLSLKGIWIIVEVLLEKKKRNFTRQIATSMQMTMRSLMRS